MNKIKSSEAPEIYLTSFITRDCFLAFEALLVNSHFCGEKQEIFLVHLVYHYLKNKTYRTLMYTSTGKNTG